MVNSYHSKLSRTCSKVKLEEAVDSSVKALLEEVLQLLQMKRKEEKLSPNLLVSEDYLVVDYPKHLKNESFHTNLL